MSIYLDNNVVSAMARDDMPSESEALNRLLAAYSEGRVALVTSEITLREINGYQGLMRPQLEQMFEMLKKVPAVSWDDLVGINVQSDKYTMINSPMIHNDPLYQALLDKGVKTIDAQHVFVAANNTCPAFLTCDGGILSRSTAIEKLCGVVVQRPSAFVASQRW